MTQKQFQISVEYWSIDKIIPYANNPRRNDHAVGRMCESIREYGFTIPVLVRSDGELIDGHLRIKAARKLGIAEIPVIVCDDWTPAQVKAFRLMINRSATWAEFDPELLQKELAELVESAVDLSTTGFESAELDAILANIHPPKDEDDIPPPPVTPISATGDVFSLGNHRLVIGDATVSDDVHKLMGEDLADVFVTDPPYNGDYEGYNKDHLKMVGDRMSDEKYNCFLGTSLKNIAEFVKPTASGYIFHASSKQREVQNAAEEAGFEVRNQIIWAKNVFAWGEGRYKFQHEPLYYVHLRGQTDPWYGDKTQSTLWQCAKPAANDIHPTMKPVELVERALINSSRHGNLVMDLFGGSGSTLIACERLKRKARILEIDPRYADCIVRRFIDFTGKQVVDANGQSFDELRKQRLGEVA